MTKKNRKDEGISISKEKIKILFFYALSLPHHFYTYKKKFKRNIFMRHKEEICYVIHILYLLI